MIRKDKVHGTIGKLIDIKVIIPDVRTFHIRRHPPEGRYFTASCVDMALEHVGGNLEKRFPNLDFRMVELGFGRLNLIGQLKECSPQPENNR